MNIRKIGYVHDLLEWRDKNGPAKAAKESAWQIYPFTVVVRGDRAEGYTYSRCCSEQWLCSRRCVVGDSNKCDKEGL